MNICEDEYEIKTTKIVLLRIAIHNQRAGYLTNTKDLSHLLKYSLQGCQEGNQRVNLIHCFTVNASSSIRIWASCCSRRRNTSIRVRKDNTTTWGLFQTKDIML